MDIALISNDRSLRSTTNRELVRHLRAQSIQVEVLAPDHTLFYIHQRGFVIYYDDTVVPLPKVVVNALGGASNKGLSLVQCFQDARVPVINRATPWRRSKIKPLTSLLFARHGIPHPATVFSVGFPPWAARVAATNLTPPLLSKPWRGAKGRGIEYLDTTADLKRTEAQYVYLQEFIENTSRHIRAVVIGDEVVGAIYRIHGPDQKITSSRTGFGDPVCCPLTDQLAHLVRRAVSCVGLDIAGVDLMEDGDELLVLEVNAWPGGHEDFHRATGISISQRIAAYLQKKL